MDDLRENAGSDLQGNRKVNLRPPTRRNRVLEIHKHVGTLPAQELIIRREASTLRPRTRGSGLQVVEINEEESLKYHD